MRVIGRVVSTGVWLAAMVLAVGILAGCAALGGAAAGRFADGLSAAILDAEDPDLVREGTPAYLLLLDALVAGDPRNPRYLAAAAQLYSAYGLVFVTDEERSQVLTAKAKDYGLRAICATHRPACSLDEADYEAYLGIVDSIPRSDASALYSYSVASLAFIRAHRGEWTAIADLPKVEHALQRLRAFALPSQLVSVNTYLGVLNTLRPEALGGRPEAGRAYFEKAIELSNGRDLSAKVEFARGYARLVYDRALHDRLLTEVLQAPVKEPGLTLFNMLAREQARELLASADDYF